MNNRVLPLARPHWLFQLIGSSVALAICAATIALNVVDPFRPFYVTVGAAGMLMFGRVFISSAEALSTKGLKLTDRGFTYDGRSYPWSDIAGFAPAGLFAKTHVRIVFAPGADLSWKLKLADTVKGAYYHPATHIPIKGYQTDGVPLAEILNDWLRRSDGPPVIN